jgi:hypothetical protein
LAYHVINNNIVEIASDFVESIFNRYLPKQSFIINNPSDIDQLYNSKINFPYVYVNSCTNPVNVEQSSIKLTGIGYNLYILTGLYKYHKQPTPNNQIKYFPFWAIWSSHQIINYNNSPRKYKFSCLNGTVWAHKILMYLTLAQKPYFKNMIFTFGNRAYFESFPSELALTVEENLNFSSLPNKVTFLDSDASWDVDVSINHPAFTDCYINLVTETNVYNDTPMLSEKTFKPILAGQLFILLASPGAVQFLRDIGIDTFDDIIDHSYDNITDVRSRIQQISDQVDRLERLDLNTIYTDIKPRLRRNSEFLKSQEFRDQFSLNFG